MQDIRQDLAQKGGKMTQPVKPALIIDADDTLWETEIYYERCIAAFADLMVGQGFGRDEAAHTVNAVERDRVPQVGYGPEEFARNLVIAYEYLCVSRGQPAEEKIAHAVWEIGRAVIEQPVVPFDGVVDTLSQLGEHCRLILLTKGDRAAQESKVARSGLAHFFDEIHVVPEKDADVMRELLAASALRPEQTWMVGNSPRSDINPALEAGVNAVYVPYANTWELEQEEIADPGRVNTLRSFSELVALFAGAEQGGES